MDYVKANSFTSTGALAKLEQNELIRGVSFTVSFYAKGTKITRNFLTENYEMNAPGADDS